jgi:hypothetical protein
VFWDHLTTICGGLLCLRGGLPLFRSRIALVTVPWLLDVPPVIGGVVCQTVQPSLKAESFGLWFASAKHLARALFDRA